MQNTESKPSVTDVSPELAESWLTAARAVEGWKGGPDYAPHPITVAPVDEDDEEIL